MSRRHTDNRADLAALGLGVALLVTVPCAWFLAACFFLLIDWVVG